VPSDKFIFCEKVSVIDALSARLTMHWQDLIKTLVLKVDGANEERGGILHNYVGSR